MLDMALKTNDAICGALEALDKFAPGEFLTITRLDPQAGETTLPPGVVCRVLVDLFREVKRHARPGASLEIATGRTLLSPDETWPGIDAGDYLTISITVQSGGDATPRFDLLRMLGIVQSGGGHLTVTAQKDGLIILRVLLPQDRQARSVQRCPPSMGETLLLAGDDLKDRGALRNLFLEQGYAVLEPGGHSPVEAIFTRFGRSIDLVVLHLASDGVDRALPEWLQSAPGVPVLICRLQEQNRLVEGKLLGKVRMLLDKPQPRQSVMVVEEDSSIRRMVVAVLEAAGYKVSEASDGSEALRSAARQKPDAIVTEVVLPGTDGLQLIEALRKSDPDVKIIAVSGSSRADTYLWVARSLGANAALHKPLWVEDLLQNIRSLLKDSLAHRVHYADHTV